MEDQERASFPVWSSYVFHEDKAWNVSTIDRVYDTYCGSCRGHETLVWEIDPETKVRGKLIAQGAGMKDHLQFCQDLISHGKIQENDTD